MSLMSSMLTMFPMFLMASMLTMFSISRMLPMLFMFYMFSVRFYRMTRRMMRFVVTMMFPWITIVEEMTRIMPVVPPPMPIPATSGATPPFGVITGIVAGIAKVWS